MEISLSNIQGNIFGGFNKDFQDFLFVKFEDAAAGRAWIKQMMDPGFEAGVARSSSEEVLKFNAQFKALRAEGIEKPEEIISAQRTNLALSFHGLQALGLTAAELDEFPDAFREGMAKRKHLIGDDGTSDPKEWQEPFNADPIDAIILVAADSKPALKERVAEIERKTRDAGLIILGIEKGRTRTDEPGHEHFGFKDGISQPGIRGINLSGHPKPANKGHFKTGQR